MIEHHILPESIEELAFHLIGPPPRVRVELNKF